MNVDKFVIQFDSLDKKEQDTLIKQLKNRKKRVDADSTKFLFILSKDQNEYLNWKSEYTMEHKARVLRSLIDKDLKNNKQFRTHLRAQKRLLREMADIEEF